MIINRWYKSYIILGAFRNILKSIDGCSGMLCLGCIHLTDRAFSKHQVRPILLSFLSKFPMRVFLCPFSDTTLYKVYSVHICIPGFSRLWSNPIDNHGEIELFAIHTLGTIDDNRIGLQNGPQHILTAFPMLIPIRRTCGQRPLNLSSNLMLILSTVQICVLLLWRAW